VILPLWRMSENRCRTRSPITGSMSQVLSTVSRRCYATAPVRSCSRVRAQHMAFPTVYRSWRMRRSVRSIRTDQILADGHTAHGLRIAILRYFNAAGADPEGERVERHNPETHLIPLAIDAAR